MGAYATLVACISRAFCKGLPEPVIEARRWDARHLFLIFRLLFAPRYDIISPNDRKGDNCSKTGTKKNVPTLRASARKGLQCLGR